MNDDLISRSALKEEFAKHEDRKGYLIGDWEEFIDNALSVEITEEQAIVKLHETGWLPRHDKEMTKSSTGHWIITNRKYELKDKDNTFIGMYHKCSECGFDEARGGKFCLNCGAYMGGGR